MTVIPVSMLSDTELKSLGNNLLPRNEKSGPVNRSLSTHDEAVDEVEEDDFFWADINHRP